MACPSTQSKLLFLIYLFKTTKTITMIQVTNTQDFLFHIDKGHKIIPNIQETLLLKMSSPKPTTPT